MNHSNKIEFRELIDGLCEAYGKDKMSAMGVRIYFDALVRFDIEQIMTAASGHLNDTKHGTFFPKVADIVRQIEGGEVTTDEVISAARLKSTPMGILCRIHIGTYDLDSQTDMFYLKQRAQECIDLLPEWKRRAAAGDYSDHEISIMLKHEVDPTMPFRVGMARPSGIVALSRRVEDVGESEMHRFMLGAPHEEEDGDKALDVDPSVAKFLAKIL